MEKIEVKNKMDHLNLIKTFQFLYILHLFYSSKQVVTDKILVVFLINSHHPKG